MERQPDSEPLLTVGDISRGLLVSPTAVQRWDALGMLCPVMRLSNGARLYRREDVARFAELRAQRLAADQILQGGNDK